MTQPPTAEIEVFSRDGISWEVRSGAQAVRLGDLGFTLHKLATSSVTGHYQWLSIDVDISLRERRAVLLERFGNRGTPV